MIAARRAEPVARERLRDQRHGPRRSRRRRSPAKTPAVTKPANDDERGEGTAHPRRARARCRAARRPRRASSASVGESASQSTFGVGITRALRDQRSRARPDRGTGAARRAGRRAPARTARRSGASSRTSKPRAWCSTAEIRRSMYIAASTIAAGADDGPAPADAVDAGEDQELARERDRAGHRERDDPGRHQQRRERRPAPRHPAEPGEGARAGARLDHPGEQEERRRDEPVRDGLEDRPVDPELVQREEAERDRGPSAPSRSTR